MQANGAEKGTCYAERILAQEQQERGGEAMVSPAAIVQWRDN